MTLKLVLGGTFDPVHFGHVQSAKALMELFPDSCVVLVPCKIPPHRGMPTASPEQRIDMLRLAIADLPDLECDDCELRREGHSYTFDTLAGYRAAMPDQPLAFVMGFDAWVTLPTWYKWRSLCNQAHLVVMTRPGSESQEVPQELKEWAESKSVDRPETLAKRSAGFICHIKLPPIDVSATEIRQAVKNGVSTQNRLHPDVASYIARHGLYLDDDSNG